MTVIRLKLDDPRLGQVLEDRIVPPPVDFEGQPFTAGECSRVHITHEGNTYFVVVPALRSSDELTFEIIAKASAPIESIRTRKTASE